MSIDDERPVAGPAEPGPEPGPEPAAAHPVTRRPIIERIGIMLVALAMAAMFALLAVAAWAGGEGFLAIMAGLGAMMTGWAGIGGVRRG